MPANKLEVVKIGFRKRMDIIKSTLTLVKGKMSSQEYNHVKRLMADGTERDLVFMQGLATGIELAALDKKSTLAIIDVLKGALQKANKGEYPPLKKADLDKIDAIMKSKFPLGARRKILSILARGDAIMLDGLIEMLKRVA
ncbi:Uncharacterised protein [uncultured archaeon]|nr:Uncharacterised protein [uncultured archaeon]